VSPRARAHGFDPTEIFVRCGPRVRATSKKSEGTDNKYELVEAVVTLINEINCTTPFAKEGFAFYRLECSRCWRRSAQTVAGTSVAGGNFFSDLNRKGRGYLLDEEIVRISFDDLH